MSIKFYIKQKVLRALSKANIEYHIFLSNILRTIFIHVYKFVSFLAFVVILFKESVKHISPQIKFSFIVCLVINPIPLCWPADKKEMNDFWKYFTSVFSHAVFLKMSLKV